MTRHDRVISAFLTMLTGRFWEPRLDPDGNAYMWLVQADDLKWAARPSQMQQGSAPAEHTK